MLTNQPTRCHSSGPLERNQIAQAIVSTPENVSFEISELISQLNQPGFLRRALQLLEKPKHSLSFTKHDRISLIAVLPISANVKDLDVGRDIARQIFAFENDIDIRLEASRKLLNEGAKLSFRAEEYLVSKLCETEFGTEPSRARALVSLILQWRISKDQINDINLKTLCAKANDDYYRAFHTYRTEVPLSLSTLVQSGNPKLRSFLEPFIKNDLPAADLSNFDSLGGAFQACRVLGAVSTLSSVGFYMAGSISIAAVCLIGAAFIYTKSLALSEKIGEIFPKLLEKSHSAASTMRPSILSSFVGSLPPPERQEYLESLIKMDNLDAKVHEKAKELLQDLKTPSSISNS